MKSYEELKIEMESIHWQMVRANKKDSASVIKAVHQIFKAYYFTSRVLKCQPRNIINNENHH